VELADPVSPASGAGLEDHGVAGLQVRVEREREGLLWAASRHFFMDYYVLPVRDRN
jgi:hypothetical protein